MDGPPASSTVFISWPTRSACTAATRDPEATFRHGIPGRSANGANESYEEWRCGMADTESNVMHWLTVHSVLYFRGNILKSELGIADDSSDARPNHGFRAKYSRQKLRVGLLTMKRRQFRPFSEEES